MYKRQSKTWGPGIRDHYLIHLVLSGKGEFEVGGRTWQVSTGDLFFARPSQLIRYTADEQYPCLLYTSWAKEYKLANG